MLLLNIEYKLSSPYVQSHVSQQYRQPNTVAEFPRPSIALACH